MTEEVPAAELAELLSTERLATYRRHAPAWGCSPLELYLHGARLASSYHHDLSIIEVVLRNALHDQLCQVYGPRWWADGQLLDDRGQDAVATAHKDVGEDPPGRLIAAVPMGFWVHLLGHGDYVGRKPFRQRRSYEALLWRPALRHAFPYSSGVRDEVHAVARRVYALRNRIAHCEPIITGVRVPGAKVRRSPAEIHEDLVTLVRWISPPVGEWLAGQSHTPGLLAHRPHTP